MYKGIPRRRNLHRASDTCHFDFPEANNICRHANKMHYRCVICVNDPKQPKPRKHNSSKSTKSITEQDMYFYKKVDLDNHTKTHLFPFACSNCNERFQKKHELDSHKRKSEKKCRVKSQTEQDALMEELGKISENIDKCKEEDPSKLAEIHETILLILPEDGDGKKLKRYDWQDGTDRIPRTNISNDPNALGKEFARNLNDVLGSLDERCRRKFCSSWLGELQDSDVDIIQEVSSALVPGKKGKKRVREASSSSLTESSFAETEEDDIGTSHRPPPKVRKQVDEHRETVDMDPNGPQDITNTSSLSPTPAIQLSYKASSIPIPHDLGNLSDIQANNMGTGQPEFPASFNRSIFNDSGVDPSEYGDLQWIEDIV
ncbi:hypothetical protein EDC01DRAFT_245520 [Geopyxis carbonaria]|nr:hypothetical protein EDC01DRAFT_245520 [Geopyxis carbonaria]